jgi:hypothetical protein
MVVIQGDTAVADIYLGEFMRLWNHFYFRDVVRLKAKSGSKLRYSAYLDPILSNWNHKKKRMAFTRVNLAAADKQISTGPASSATARIISGVLCRPVIPTRGSKT